MTQIICLMGPTASGKTALAMALADHYGEACSLISVDSALVYQGMDVGTSKPTDRQLVQYPHALVDVREPNEAYDAASFAKDAGTLIHQAVEANKTPILVGGTMLYFKALLEGLSPLPQADPSIRVKLSQIANKEGLEALYQRLADVDPVRASQIKPNDSQRIIRALEIHTLTGTPPSQLEPNKPVTWPVPVRQYVLWPSERLVLHGRIEQRFTEMVEAGLVAEVQNLMSKAWFDPDLPAMRAVGYRQCIEYLKGKVSHEEFVQKATAATRQLAKRQLTWLRSWPFAHQKLECTPFNCASLAAQISSL